jgi:hypothetical protein
LGAFFAKTTPSLVPVTWIPEGTPVGSLTNPAATSEPLSEASNGPKVKLAFNKPRFVKVLSPLKVEVDPSGDLTIHSTAAAPVAYALKVKVPPGAM